MSDLKTETTASTGREAPDISALLYGVWLHVFVALYPFVWGEDALNACHEERLLDKRLHKW